VGAGEDKENDGRGEFKYLVLAYLIYLKTFVNATMYPHTEQ
jgi:hypothetical protein